MDGGDQWSTTFRMHRIGQRGKQVYSTISSDSSKLEFWARNSLPLLSAAASKGENAPNYLCIEWMRKITVGYGRLLLFFSETSSSRDTCVLLLSARIGRE
ncbi:hypothetical protein GQ457_04G031450 [Hibiscus cannabinus]